MGKKYHKKPDKQVKIAQKRIKFLFDEAANAFKADQKLSNKYVKIARRIAMKYKIRLPPSIKKRFCRNCHAYLVPGVNLRVRLHKHKIIQYCLECKHYSRKPIR